MASLALVVTILFLVVLFSGPIIYFIAKYKILPKVIVQILSCFVCFIGLWWFFTLPTFVGLLGILTTFLGWKALLVSRNST